MKTEIKASIIGIISFCIFFYLGKFIMYKLNVVDNYDFDIATVIGFAIGWILAEVIMYKIRKKNN